MKKYLFIGLLAGLTGCAYVGPVPVAYVEAPTVEIGVFAPEPFIFFNGPYYGPIWNGYYWSAERHSYYRPHDGWRGPIGYGPRPFGHSPQGHSSYGQGRGHDRR